MTSVLLPELPADALQLIAESLFEGHAALGVRLLSKAWDCSILSAAVVHGGRNARRLLLIKSMQQRNFGKRARKVIVVGDSYSGKSTLCKQLIRACGAEVQLPYVSRGLLLAQTFKTILSLVAFCDEQSIEIQDEAAIQRFELLLLDDILGDLILPEAKLEPQTLLVREQLGRAIIQVLERLSHDAGIAEAATRWGRACAAHNLPRLLARCEALYGEGGGAQLEPTDDLLLYVRTTGVVELPELSWPPQPHDPAPPLLRLRVVDCVGAPLERCKLMSYLDASVDLACFVASLACFAESGADGLAATTDLLESFYRGLAERSPRARILIVLTQHDALEDHIARVGTERWEEMWPQCAADMRLDAAVGGVVHPANVAARYFARELTEAVSRARASDTPEAAARHRNIAPRVVCLHSALDLDEVRGSLWPDQLAVELLGGWSAVFTPAAARELLDGALLDGEAGRAEPSSSDEGEGDDVDLPSSGVEMKAKARVAVPRRLSWPGRRRPSMAADYVPSWLIERFGRLWR